MRWSRMMILIHVANCKKRINLTANCYQMKFFQMHQCAMAFRPKMAFRPEMTFWPEMALRSKTILSNSKWLLGQKWQWTRMAFKSKIAFLLEIAYRPIILLSNLFAAFWLQMPYFSKYWKVWLTFDGWKLSGLLKLDLWSGQGLVVHKCTYYWFMIKITKLIVIFT